MSGGPQCLTLARDRPEPDLCQPLVHLPVRSIESLDFQVSRPPSKLLPYSDYLSSSTANR